MNLDRPFFWDPNLGKYAVKNHIVCMYVYNDTTRGVFWVFKYPKMHFFITIIYIIYTFYIRYNVMGFFRFPNVSNNFHAVAFTDIYTIIYYELCKQNNISVYFWGFLDFQKFPFYPIWFGFK